MKITKYVHACLLVEDAGVVVLVDPGVFSYEAKIFDVNSLPKLDYIVVTHEHQDHLHMPFLNELLAKFPNAKIITTPSVVENLKQAGITNTSSESDGPVEVFSKKSHADLSPFGAAPENIAVHLNGKLTIGGDRHDLEESKDALALTITAPWGSMMNAAKMALNLNPKTVIPIHDWHWNETARAGAYSMCDGLFKEKGINFIKPVDGQAFEV